MLPQCGDKVRDLRRSAGDEQLELLRSRLGEGFDISVADRKRRNSLGLAACNGHVEAVRVLLDRVRRPMNTARGYSSQRILENRQQQILNLFYTEDSYGYSGMNGGVTAFLCSYSGRACGCSQTAFKAMSKCGIV